MNAKLIFSTILLLTFGVLVGKAQTTTVEVRLQDGGVHSYEMGATGKLYFQNDYLFIDDGTNVPYTHLVSNIEKMLFSYEVSIEDIETADCKVYPNPASSFLKISTINTDVNHYQIFSIDGRMLMAGDCRNDESIDVSALPQGLYLLKVNGQTFKISKL